ncbi:MAG TPA: hypothetical protein DCS67_10290 [Clostridiales bacterium UBA8960]|nr:hypothetical protein [Clostridiales bacterium UBA8960]
MENTALTRFKSKLQKRNILATAYNFFVVLIILINRSLGKELALPDESIHFTIGFFVGIQLLVIIGMFKTQSALRDDAKLRALYIKEHDERTLSIEEKIGGPGINLIIAALGLATIIAIYLNQTVFFTLLSTLIFTVIVKAALKLYYRKTL